MTNNFDKARKMLGMRTATECAKVNIMQGLLDGGLIPSKVPSKDSGIDGM